ncbi:hypothetical protein PHYPSEUDO_001115 [Phytophthora pseudosyringae]|uniref:Uncharacterized protein n=1 Tax=Phytophthora pseudosyringae TaxID=221518 RepID=A0A8T1VWC6_9STRA|nr:hypothetical protein PHYPSEUDO_001115 [Phytophthora pseudosyringae]
MVDSVVLVRSEEPRTEMVARTNMTDDGEQLEMAGTGHMSLATQAYNTQGETKGNVGDESLGAAPLSEMNEYAVVEAQSADATVSSGGTAASARRNGRGLPQRRTTATNEERRPTRSWSSSGSR